MIVKLYHNWLKHSIKLIMQLHKIPCRGKPTGHYISIFTIENNMLHFPTRICLTTVDSSVCPKCLQLKQM